MSRSDFKSLALLTSVRGRNEATAIDVYKASVAVANSGLIHHEEKHLGRDAKALLEIRRLLRAGFREQAEINLRALVTPDALLAGDREFLLANVALRNGLPNETADRMAQAAISFAEAGDDHREQRALINQMIATATLEQCLYGELRALEQQARRSEHFDLVAHVQRTRALEFLRVSRPLDALLEARAAVVNYDLDGDPDDRAVAQSLEAIAHLLLGQANEAKVVRESIPVSEGKVASYLAAYQSLLSGRTPNIPKGHPLDGLDWRTQSLKRESIPGRIIQRLRVSPATRDELIASVWGETADHPSYHARLYTAINAAKKSFGITIRFDGLRYRAD